MSVLVFGIKGTDIRDKCTNIWGEGTDFRDESTDFSVYGYRFTHQQGSDAGHPVPKRVEVARAVLQRVGARVLVLQIRPGFPLRPTPA